MIVTKKNWCMAKVSTKNKMPIVCVFKYKSFRKADGLKIQFPKYVKKIEGTNYIV